VDNGCSMGSWEDLSSYSHLTDGRAPSRDIDGHASILKDVALSGTRSKYRKSIF